MALQKSQTFNYVVIFVLGILIAANAFTFWQFNELKKVVDAQRSDITTIIQAYNNLVTTLQEEGIGAQKAQVDN